MKTAYELAMERLKKSAPTVKLTDAQKKELAELDSQYAAKIAAREIALKSEMDSANTAGEFDKAAELQQQLAKDKKSLQAELEDRKEKIRNSR